MISCTEFIPLYSELFDFLEQKKGKQEVVKYWEHISDTYVQQFLGTEVEKSGIKGCWDYWSKSLNEEACDFSMTLDEENGTFEIDMHHCPSRGMLNELKHMTPYNDYCGHCEVLYKRVLEKYGIEMQEYDLSNVANAACKVIYKQKHST